MNLLVFVKYPYPGQVKTRLATKIGADHACALYRACVQDLLASLQQASLQATICYAPNAAVSQYRAWLGPHWSYQEQQGADLGQRMANALLQSITPGQATILIGSDLPDLPAKHILMAEHALRHVPLCLGPALDGGFYLIGLSTPLALDQIFANLTWSTPQVLDQVLANCRSLNLASSLIPAWPDLDTAADLKDFILRGPSGSNLTMAYIQENNLQHFISQDLN